MINPDAFAVCLSEELGARRRPPLSLSVERDAPRRFGPTIITVRWDTGAQQETISLREEDVERRGPEGIAALICMRRRARTEAMSA